MQSQALPAVIYTQTAVVAGVQIAKEVSSLDRISAIEIATTRRGYERTGSEPEKWSPKTRETADHSLPYITARAMLDGDITNESFAPEKFHDPAVSKTPRLPPRSPASLALATLHKI